ncbi:hypothetical protein B0T19DRAFT_422103 [Cercophora scortea]|uniref:Inner membrane assembly complex subunit 17 n=1 Tax=Cercophora scortea TaxID=314031 RepID=A0AAE0MCW0_9PEZI|nr:hypothetical protein B0T19DRAFT_422103 [Cercophora scortea]
MSRTIALRPLRSIIQRQPSSLSTIARPHQQVQSQARHYSAKAPTPTGEFYKTFTRPVAKCVLVAIFTYQLVYWGWTKLEHDEIVADRKAEISRLENQVRALQASSTTAKPSDGVDGKR